jgi:hypothetical protein
MLCGMRYLFRLIDLRAFAREFPPGLRNLSNRFSGLPIELLAVRPRRLVGKSARGIEVYSPH